MSGKLLTIVGVTGAQGGAIVDPALKAGFKVRGLTRKVDSDKAKALAAKGVELVTCDIAKESLEAIAKAFEGSHAVFLLTQYWDPDTKGKEFIIGKALVDAAKAAKVKHVLWSGLANAKTISNGKWNVPMFTDKALVGEYIESLQKQTPRAFDYYTDVSPSFYYQNFQGVGLAKKEEDTWVFNLPETRHLTCFDVTEMGFAVVAALLEPSRFDGKRIEYFGEHCHPNIYVETFKRVTGEKARLNSIPVKVFEANSQEIAHMFGFIDEYTGCGPDSTPFADWSGWRNTPGGLSTWETFLKNGGFKL